MQELFLRRVFALCMGHSTRSDRTGRQCLFGHLGSTHPRWQPNPVGENLSWGDFTRGRFEAKEKNFKRAVLQDQAGNVTERPRFNVFVIKGDTVMTSSQSVLGGLTHRSVVEIVQTLGLRVEIVPLPRAELLSADEVFISSFAGGVIPLV